VVVPLLVFIRSRHRRDSNHISHLPFRVLSLLESTSFPESVSYAESAKDSAVERDVPVPDDVESAVPAVPESAISASGESEEVDAGTK
jgi:hypothetical protein